jgi:hypothetical protein
MFNVDENTQEAGSGGQYLEAGFHGPAFVTFSYENFSPQGTADNDGLAVYIEDENGATARIMIGEPDSENEKAMAAVQGKFKQFLKTFSNSVKTSGSTYKEFCENFINLVGDTSKQPVWIKLQYRAKNYPDLGKGVFIEPYKPGQECTLVVQGDQMEKKEAPTDSTSEPASAPSESDVL